MPNFVIWRGEQERIRLARNVEIRGAISLSLFAMAGARGRNYHRLKLVALPHIVECPIPGSGLRSRLDAMHAWCRERCGNDGYATSSRVDRALDGTPQDVLLVHFPTGQNARAFAMAFGLPYRPK